MRPRSSSLQPCALSTINDEDEEEDVFQPRKVVRLTVLGDRTNAQRQPSVRFDRAEQLSGVKKALPKATSDPKGAYTTAKTNATVKIKPIAMPSKLPYSTGGSSSQSQCPAPVNDQAHVNSCLDRSMASAARCRTTDANSSSLQCDVMGELSASELGLEAEGALERDEEETGATGEVSESLGKQREGTEIVGPSPLSVDGPCTMVQCCDSGVNGDDSSISMWLASLRLTCYLDLFHREEIDLEAVQHLSAQDFEDIGIGSAEHRQRLACAAANLPTAGDLALGVNASAVASAYIENGLCGGVTAAKKESVSREKAKVFFGRLQPAPVTPAPVEAAVRAHTGAAVSHSQERGHLNIGPKGGRSRPASGSSCIPPPRSDHRFVHGTNFVVDGFTSNFSSTNCKHWFLTHFHSDHYQGLSSTFQRGVIYCSPITAALVVQELRVRPSRIFRVPLNQPITVEGVRVTFLEANHCPGAAMILFEPPSGAAPVLHTGDVRCCQAMQEQAALQAVRGRVRLVLDATYCTPEYDAPPQEEAVKMVVDGVRSEAFNPNTLFLIGTYKIGKERCFLEVGRQLERKIYVSETKMKVLRCLNLDPEHMKWLTTDDKKSDIHVQVPMQKVSMKAVKNSLRFYRGRYKTVVVFKPTGWVMQRGKAHANMRGRRQQRGTVITYQVPYSEHSNLSELRDFVSWLQPSATKLHSFSGRSEAECVALLGLNNTADDAIASRCATVL